VACAAVAAGTPAATSRVCMTDGKLDARPTIKKLKKRPMDNTMPLFWKVVRIPEAAPRSSGGTEFITAAVLGDANEPNPRPVANKRTAKTG
jgi:hypothetical protein